MGIPVPTINITILPLNPSIKGCNINYEFTYATQTYQRYIFVSFGETEILMKAYADAFAAAVKAVVDATMPARMATIQATYPNYPDLTEEEWEDYNQEVADARVEETATAETELAQTMPTGDFLECFAEIGKQRITNDLQTIAKYWNIVKTFSGASFNVTV